MTSKETKRNVGVMKKARLLVLCLILMIMMILSGCSIESDNISLDDISIDDGMKVTATVNINNIDLENFRKGTDNTLSFITVVYAYTQDKITALEADDEYVGKNPQNCPTTPIPTDIHDGTEDFQVSEEDVAAFKDGTETSYSKQLEFPIPEAAKGKKVDFFVVLTGKDDGWEGKASSGIFTFIPAPTVTAPTPKTLTYNGSAQELVTAGTAEGGTMQYALGADESTAPAETAFTASIPTATDIGTYYVWFKAKGNTGYTDSTPACVQVTIGKAEPVVTAPTAKTLTYTGSAQELVNAGNTTGGTMQYVLGTKDAATGSYTTSIPTGTEAGTYYVWYKVAGDGNHSDSEPKCVEAKIESAPAEVPPVSVTAHVQRKGTLKPAVGGAIAGTTGKSLRMESLRLNVDGASEAGGIEYRGHVQRKGWEKSFVRDGAMAGTEGKSRRLEAVQIRLWGDMASKNDVYYRVHVQRYGWMAWAKNGEEAGTQGMSRRVEAIQVVLVKKDAPAPAADFQGATQAYGKAFAKK